MRDTSCDPAGGADLGSIEGEGVEPPAPVAPPDGRPSRRRFFAMGVSLAAASVAGAGSAAAQQTSSKPSAARGMVKRLLQQPPNTGFDPFGRTATPTQKGWDSALTRLVRRVTNGVTEDELKLAQKLGYNGYLNYHLGHAKIDDGQVQTFVSQNYPLLTQTVDQLYNIDQRLVIDQLTEGAVYRAAFSKRQLYERMVEFWSDHFNIAFPQVNYLKLVDDRDVIRRHALGRFPDLLKAAAHSPALLEYLDNTRNRQRTLNENFAREIMELYTLGADGGYTQGDVRELARVFTGWTLAGRGTFSFEPSSHDFGAKTVLGQVFPAMPSSAGAAGKGEGDQMLDVLARHPSTAKFIARKLLRWLLQYEPTTAQVTAVATVYTKTQGDITAMVRAVLSPANVAAAAPKFKRPYTYMLSALRGVKPTVSKVATISDRWLRLLGQPMFYWDPPDGYPDEADYWAGGVMQRWNFAVYLTTTSGELTMDVTRFTAVNTAEGIATAIGKELFGGEMPDRLRGQLMTYLAVQATPTQARVREAVALALSSSTFQWI
jgi:hypothetical protein